MLVSQIADILEVSVSQVHKYIQYGLLKSDLRNNIRYIEENDFDEFYKNYFLSRHKQKGKSIPTNEQFQTLKEFTNDIESPLSYDSFVKKYKNLKTLMPPVEDFKLLKRNLCIANDRNNGMKISDIAIKYDLSIRSIEEIVKKYIRKSK